MRIMLCVNCLENVQRTVTPVYWSPGTQIGGDYGSQRDPEHDSIDLCKKCEDALRKGDMRTIHDRYREERNVNPRRDFNYFGPGGAGNDDR